MKHFKNDLFDEFGIMAYEMNKIFDQLLRAKTPPRMGCQQGWSPPCDVYETREELVVWLEVPGIKKKDVKVELDKNILRVHGHRSDLHADHKISFYQMEIHCGHFEKVIPLPYSIASNKVVAEYKNGFLRITLPKSEPKKIPW